MIITGKDGLPVALRSGVLGLNLPSDEVRRPLDAYENAEAKQAYVELLADRRRREADACA